MAQAQDMIVAKKVLENYGHEVEMPDLSENRDWSHLSFEKKSKSKDRLIQHLAKISGSDAILVLNKEKKGISGYVGGNTLMEMAFAYAQGIEIFLLNDARDMSYADEIYGMQPTELGGKIELIDEYFKKLPKTIVSSASPIKLRAVSRGLRRAGIRTQVLSCPTESKIAEQPQNIDETYEGAQNRHKTLQQKTSKESPTYLATIESGLHQPHKDHNYFEVMIVILQKAGESAKTGISLELEYPREMTDRVPSEYPDLGSLAQAEYGAVLKDPFPVFTNGKIDRLQLLERAVFDLAVQ